MIGFHQFCQCYQVPVPLPDAPADQPSSKETGSAMSAEREQTTALLKKLQKT